VRDVARRHRSTKKEPNPGAASLAARPAAQEGWAGAIAQFLDELWLVRKLELADAVGCRLLARQIRCTKLMLIQSRHHPSAPTSERGKPVRDTTAHPPDTNNPHAQGIHNGRYRQTPSTSLFDPYRQLLGA